MADFRKWLFAFAVVAVLLASGVPAQAQVFNPNAFACFIAATVPPTVRSEGIAELVGDVVLQCSGGTPTPAGAVIPTSNITIFLNTNVTSRLVGPNFATASEALLLIDEPYPTANNPSTVVTPPNSATQVYCPVGTNGFIGNANGPNCVVGGLKGTGGGVGNTGPYGAGNPNVFQGQQQGANAVAWNGVAIDAPGTTGTRVLRFTNLRANACQLGVSSTLVPSQIFAFISVTGSQQVTITTPQQTVAFVLPGLIASNGTNSFQQCNNLNGNLISSSTPTGVVAAGISMRADEGFASSFKARGFSINGTGSGGSFVADGTIGQAPVTLQNVPGFPYFTESGFVSAAVAGTANGAHGVADQGTRVMFAVNNAGAGVSLYAPTYVTLTVQSTANSSNGLAVLVTGTDANGNGGTLSTIPGNPAAPASGALAPITISGTSGFVVYEIIRANPNALERITVPLSVAFVSNTASNLPAIGQSTVTTSFAPLSTVTTASATAPIPRFCNTATPRNIFSIITCACDLLFPFVTNQAGFDTGIALANTSADVFGTVPQSGTVKLSYFGNTTGGGAAPAAQTSQVVSAGNELVFTLSGGGNLGIAATPGFQGYIIAVANFQFCHAFAFISDLGSQRLAEGYLAIQLDISGSSLNRTGLFGENEGH